MCNSWKWPTDMMTTSESTVRIATFIIPRFAQWATCWSSRVSASSWVHGWRFSMSPNPWSPAVMTFSSCVPFHWHHMVVCTQPGNGTSLLCFARSGGSFPNSVECEHSQALVVVAMYHYSSCVPSSNAWDCLENFCPTLCLPYRQTPTVREYMGWIFAGHSPRMFYCLLASACE